MNTANVLFRAPPALRTGVSDRIGRHRAVLSPLPRMKMELT